MRLLVVGGTGFIGRNIVERGLALGWQITAVSLNARQNIGRPAHFIGVDIADRAALREALGDAEFDYVVNCGGYVDHTSFSQGGRSVIDTHFAGVMNLAQTI